jgi:hypothetical protein
MTKEEIKELESKTDNTPEIEEVEVEEVQNKKPSIHPIFENLFKNWGMM